MEFDVWFQQMFKVPVPTELAKFIAEYPKGLCVNGRSIWNAEEIMACTEERDLQEKGACIIGSIDDVHTLLLRAKDGRCFVVDPTDYQVVDAWFSDIDSMGGLLNLYSEVDP